MTTVSNKSIPQALKFLKSLEGVKRTGYCHDTPPDEEGPPFWIGPGPLPCLEEIQRKGSVCVGLGNLVRRYMGLEVPGKVTGKKLNDWPGGTESWFEYLSEEGRLEEISFQQVYPPGTLLIQDFNTKDQGHIAITVDSSDLGLLKSTIIHNIADQHFYGTYIHTLDEYPNYQRHTHICLPQNWLLKN